MTIASKPHIPFLWRLFLRLGSSSSCCVQKTLYHTRAPRVFFIYLPYLNQRWRCVQSSLLLYSNVNGLVKCERWTAEPLYGLCVLLLFSNLLYVPARDWITFTIFCVLKRWRWLKDEFTFENTHKRYVITLNESCIRALHEIFLLIF